MDRRFWTWGLLVVAAALALASLVWAVASAQRDSADLLRREREVRLFVRGEDPYALPDMTYPPSAPPVFTALIAPVRGKAIKSAWVLLNLCALAVLAAGLLHLGPQVWPAWARVAFTFVVVAGKPTRGGIGLGQFHLIPTALLAAAAELLARGRSLTAGLFVGVALVKPTMALPFLGYLVARRAWASIAVALGFQSACAIGTSAWVGVGPVQLAREWLANAKSQETLGTIDVPTVAHRLGLPWNSSSTALVLLAIGFALTIAWRRKSDLGLLALVTFQGAVFTYHRPYDMVLLYPSLAYLIGRAVRARGPVERVGKGTAAGLFALTLIAPNQPLDRMGLGGYYDLVFVVACYGFGALLLWELWRERPGEGGEAATTAGA